VERLVKLVSSKDSEHYFPNRLSGGMKQRVAIARALAYDPELLSWTSRSVLWMRKTRGALQVQFEQIWQESGKTVLFITHSVRKRCNLSIEFCTERTSRRVHEEVWIESSAPARRHVRRLQLG